MWVNVVSTLGTMIDSTNIGLCNGLGLVFLTIFNYSDHRSYTVQSAMPWVNIHLT